MNQYEEVYLSNEELEMIIVEYQRKQLVENLTGPGVSLIAHLVLLILCFVFIITASNNIDPSLVVETCVVEEIEIDQEIVEDEKITDPVEAPSTEIGEETSPVDVNDDIPQTNDQSDMEEVLDIINNNSVLSFISPTGGRTDAGRKNAIGKYGNGPNTRKGQERLNRALRWLASVQNENGSWGTGNGWSETSGHPAHTGLALLVFLAHGDTPLSEQYGDTVQKAMRWLAIYGTQSDLRKIIRKKHGAYTHGIATYALAESYAMTKIPFIQNAMELSVNEIIEGQMANGGFGYGYTSGTRWDMSVAGWNMQALKAAKMAGSPNEKLSSAIKKSINFCKVAYGGQGGFGYAENPGNGANMGGVGTVAMQLLGASESRQVREGCERIGKTRLAKYEEVMADPTKWSTIGGQCLYGWYYDTQAIFNSQNVDKARWKAWRKAFETVLINSQNKEGYWETNGQHGIGAANTDGRVLSTALCCLQLEVYYRYLPTFDKSIVEKFNENDFDLVGNNGGGMVIEIE